MKKTGEDLPAEQWERFEAAVDAAVKSGPKHRNEKMPVDKNLSPRKASEKQIK